MTAEEINLLPEKVRDYIHNLETNCDPAGNLKTIAALNENIKSLNVKLNNKRYERKTAIMAAIISNPNIIKGSDRLVENSKYINDIAQSFLYL